MSEIKKEFERILMVMTDKGHPVDQYSKDAFHWAVSRRMVDKYGLTLMSNISDANKILASRDGDRVLYTAEKERVFKIVQGQRGLSELPEFLFDFMLESSIQDDFYREIGNRSDLVLIALSDLIEGIGEKPKKQKPSKS
jgi:hypothetical protein